jgi:hypothetical protein
MPPAFNNYEKSQSQTLEVKTEKPEQLAPFHHLRLQVKLQG